MSQPNIRTSKILLSVPFHFIFVLDWIKPIPLFLPIYAVCNRISVAFLYFSNESKEKFLQQKHIWITDHDNILRYLNHVKPTTLNNYQKILFFVFSQNKFCSVIF